MPKVANPYFAAVDLGSNSFHLLIMRLQQGVIEVVDREKDMVQLALGLTPNGGLTKAAQKRALTCLKRFGERNKNGGPAVWGRPLPTKRCCCYSYTTTAGPPCARLRQRASASSHGQKRAPSPRSRSAVTSGRCS